MAKHLRKARELLSRRQKGTVAARDAAVSRNSALRGNIDKAYRMPGSMKGRS